MRRVSYRKNINVYRLYLIQPQFFKIFNSKTLLLSYYDNLRISLARVKHTNTTFLYLTSAAYFVQNVISHLYSLSEEVAHRHMLSM